MNRRLTHILITGAPGVGKTTIVKALFSELGHLRPIGFFTEEIREKGVRKGFRLIGHGGQSGILAHVNIPSAARVSRYGVDVAAFEGFLDSLDLLESSSALVIIDEIGKMECFSGKFLVLLDRLWSSEKRVIATIAMTSSGPMAAIRSRSDVKLLTLTADNRQGFCRRIIGELGLL